MLCGDARSSFIFRIFLAQTIADAVLVSGTTFQNITNSAVCVPAEATPSLDEPSSCYPLVNFTMPGSFCHEHGVVLSDRVYRRPDQQIHNNERAHTYYKQLQTLKNVPLSCLPLHTKIAEIMCRFAFPACDATTSAFQEKNVCKATCLQVFYPDCGIVIDEWRKAYLKIHPEDSEFLTCHWQPVRNAGEPPECWYLDFAKEATKDQMVNTDCLYQNGSSYNGNISVTVSGVRCQSWTSQCPHRHTMNTTYPELNEASNYCRNPHNSGKLPWCFTTDRRRRWEYCNISNICTPVDGNYGNWSLSNSCNVTCGNGLETWSRACDNPPQRYGGKNCSRLGYSKKYKICRRKPCPVNGGFGNWTLSRDCNVSCGKGVEVWRRACDKPAPRNGGENCSSLGPSIEMRNCSKHCQGDGNYSEWSKMLSCTVKCGGGMEVWRRKCSGVNCSKYGKAEETRPCNQQACNVVVKRSVQKIGIATGIGSAGIITVIVIVVVFVRKWRRKRNEDFEPYAVLHFVDMVTSTSPEPPSTVNASDPTYENTTDDGNRLPGEGVVNYRHHYANTEKRSLYDKLNVFSPVVSDWLRNAWGNVDRFGVHVYDVIRRPGGMVLPYSRLGKRSDKEMREKPENELDNATGYSRLNRGAEMS